MGELEDYLWWIIYATAIEAKFYVIQRTKIGIDINRHYAVILVIEIWFAVVGSRIHILSVLTHMHYCWN